MEQLGKLILHSVNCYLKLLSNLMKKLGKLILQLVNCNFNLFVIDITTLNETIWSVHSFICKL